MATQVNCPVVKLPVTFSVPAPENVISFWLTLLPITILPFTVRIPPAEIATLQSLLLFPELALVKEAHVIIPELTYNPLLLTPADGGFIVTAPVILRVKGPENCTMFDSLAPA